MKPAGGIERVVSNLANEWINVHQIFILVKDEGYSFYDLNPKILIRSINKPLRLNMNNRVSRIYTLARNIIVSHHRLKKILASIDPDVIYTANPLNSMEIYLAGGEYTNKLVISEHGSKLGYNGVYNLIKKFVYPKANKISVPTTLDAELYKKEGLPAVFIPHVSTFKSQTKVNTDNKQILNIGRFTKDKQQIVLLGIWNRIVTEKKHGEWKLLLVGSGEEEIFLQQYVSKNNLKDTVTIVKPSKDVERFFNSSSIFAFTSQYEGFGMVLLEAMSFGVPCISFNCPSGPRDIVDDGINGYLIENRNLEEYKVKLIELMNNMDLRDKYSNASFNKASKWDNYGILQKWYALFEDVNP